MTEKERNDYFYVCSLIEYILQAARAPAVTPLMAAAAAILIKPLREILFIGTLSFFLFFFCVPSYRAAKQKALCRILNNCSVEGCGLQFIFFIL